VVAEIERVEGRRGNAAGAGGGHAPNPNTHNPSISGAHQRSTKGESAS
jgi:hypothetical protein